MTDDLTLSVDLGTSSVRAALVDRRGTIAGFASRGFAQTIPRFAWAEQSATAWWQRRPRRSARWWSKADRPIAAVCVCGQMHGTVLIGAGDGLASDSVLLWNDKRSTPEVEAWERGRPEALPTPPHRQPRDPGLAGIQAAMAARPCARGL